MPCRKKSVSTVVIREGTRKRTVMIPLTAPTSHAEHKPGNRTDGQRHAPGNGHKGHDVRSEREGAADGKINLAGDHQHDFGDGDQTEPTGVAKDDSQKLGGQKLPGAAKLEVDYEKDRDDSDAGFSITGENDQ
jgi:hypothetical protein